MHGIEEFGGLYIVPGFLRRPSDHARSSAPSSALRQFRRRRGTAMFVGHLERSRRRKISRPQASRERASRDRLRQRSFASSNMQGTIRGLPRSVDRTRSRSRSRLGDRRQFLGSERGEMRRRTQKRPSGHDGDLLRQRSYGDGGDQSCRAAEYRYREAVSVVGYDGDTFTAYTSPPLQTIKHENRQVSLRAVELLMDVLKGNPGDKGNDFARADGAIPSLACRSRRKGIYDRHDCIDLRYYSRHRN